MSHCRAKPTLACAYFFFDGRDSQKALQQHENLIRSLILQFSHQCGGGMPAPLVQLYRMCMDGHQQPPIDSLHDTLQQILAAFDQAYIIIDALDECADRNNVLNWIQKISSWKGARLHLLATSRPEPDIKKQLGSLDPSCICLEEESNNNDIETYINWMLDTNDQLRDFNKETQDKIKVALKDGAKGMYVCFPPIFEIH